MYKRQAVGLIVHDSADGLFLGLLEQGGGGVGSALANILWVVLVGWWMALGYLGAGVLNCITIIGIPFGLQSFKMAKLALWPFGAEIVNL